MLHCGEVSEAKNKNAVKDKKGPILQFSEAHTPIILWRATLVTQRQTPNSFTAARPGQC